MVIGSFKKKKRKERKMSQRNKNSSKYKDLSSRDISNLVYNTKQSKEKKYQSLGLSNGKRNNQEEFFELNNNYSSSDSNSNHYSPSNKNNHNPQHFNSIPFYTTNDWNEKKNNENNVNNDSAIQSNNTRNDNPTLEQNITEINNITPCDTNNNNEDDLLGKQGNSLNSSHSKIRLFQFIRLHTKLNELLSVKLERPDQANQIASILKKIRINMSIDEIIIQHFDKKFLIPLISSSNSFIRYQFLVEEMLAFIVPLTRKEETKEQILDDILSSGSLIFCLIFLRIYMTNPNIRTLIIELLAKSIDFVLDNVKNQNSKFKNRKYCDLSFIVHEMILHGAVTYFPDVLSLIVESHSEIGIRRILKCNSFIFFDIFIFLTLF